jgi:hypothetical protein
MWENMLEETLKELFHRERTFFELAGIRSAILKGNLGRLHAAAILESQQTAIADGHPMDIRSQILESGLAIANGFAMDNPIPHPDLGGDLLQEFQFLQTAPEGGPKQFGESAHR